MLIITAYIIVNEATLRTNFILFGRNDLVCMISVNSDFVPISNVPCGGLSSCGEIMIGTHNAAIHIATITINDIARCNIGLCFNANQFLPLPDNKG